MTTRRPDDFFDMAMVAGPILVLLGFIGLAVTDGQETTSVFKNIGLLIPIGVAVGGVGAVFHFARR